MAVTTIDVHAAKELINNGHRCLDVRTEEEHRKGHVPGAVNVPFLFFKPEEGKERNPKFLEQVSAICNKDDLIVLGCASGARSSLASKALVESGFGNVKNMAGGYAAWVQNGFAINNPSVEIAPPHTSAEISVTTVDVHAAKELIHTADHRYLDVRTMEEFNKGHVHGAVNIPYLFFTPEGKKKNPNFLEQFSAIYSSDDAVVVGCAGGNRSIIACKDLVDAGFKHVKNMGGGYNAWVGNGLLVNAPETSSPEVAAPSAA